MIFIPMASGVLNPCGPRTGQYDEQALKRVWHYVARFGSPDPPLIRFTHTLAEITSMDLNAHTTNGLAHVAWH
jgi:hypothetical protein